VLWVTAADVPWRPYQGFDSRLQGEQFAKEARDGQAVLKDEGIGHPEHHRLSPLPA
jgi:hypothetical protein